MRELLVKKEKKAKTLKKCMAIGALLLALLSITMGALDVVVSVVILNVVAWFILINVIIYLRSCYSINRSLKLLKQVDMLDAADDINVDDIKLPESKICCGSRAFYSKRNGAIIPYSEVAWVYLRIDKVNGITVSKSVVVFTKTVMQFTLSADKDEFNWLLRNYIIPNSPDVLVGFNKENKKQYKIRYKKK